MVNLLSNKHTFWQALIIAFVIFWTGIMLGIMFEGSRASKLEKFYLNSETELFDVQLKSELLKLFNYDCDLALEENINFAERIYNEAKTLEKYDASNKITEDIINIHRRYDLLRTMLWKNLIELQSACPKKTNTIVYLYQYDQPSIETQAKQITMSKVLLDLKRKYGDEAILIPIAYDTDVKSLSLLIDKYDIENFPVVFINQKHEIADLSTAKDLEKYLE